LIGIAIVAVLACTISGPKRESLEWHKKKYLAAWDRVNDKDWRGRMITYYATKRGKYPPRFFFLRSEEYDVWIDRLYRHRNALIELGYLREKVVTFSNVSARDVDAGTRAIPRSLTEDERFTFCAFDVPGNTNALRIIAPASTIVTWEDCIRRMDVPKNEK
jgi:hypothetical protein